MSVLIKKMGGREYAYMAYRKGLKVVHKYIGPTGNKEVASRIFLLKSEKTVPKKYYPFFWDTNPQELNTKRHPTYIIERILETGDMDSFRWLQMAYSGNAILKVLETSKRLSPKTKNFWEVWYGIRNAH